MCESIYLSICIFVAFFVHASLVCVCEDFSVDIWHEKELSVAQRQIPS